MLKLLLKKQLAEIFCNYFYDPKKNRARSKVGTAVYFILFIGIMVGFLDGLFAYLSLSICGALSAAGLDWLFFALMGLLAVLLGVFGSVFNTYSCLYLSRDNDLMLSLPIPVNVIMASRLLTVYLMGLMYSLVVILPAVIVYWVTVSAPIELIMAVLVPLSYVLLSSLFGLFLGLKMPNLSWISEITPIKQSACVTIALFSGFGYTAFLCAGFMLLNGWKLGFTGYMALFGGVTLALCALLWLWPRNKGCSRFGGGGFCRPVDPGCR